MGVRITTPTTSFGLWELKTNDTIYQAVTIGFVVAYSVTAGVGYPVVKTDPSTPPTVVRIQAKDANWYDGVMCPIKKKDYWKVEGAEAVYWMSVQ